MANWELKKLRASCSSVAAETVSENLGFIYIIFTFISSTRYVKVHNAF